MKSTEEETVRGWTAKRKSALVLELIKGQTTVSEANRTRDLRNPAREPLRGSRSMRDIVADSGLLQHLRYLIPWHRPPVDNADSLPRFSTRQAPREVDSE